MAERKDTAFNAGTKTPVEQGLLARVVEGVKYVLNPTKTPVWFGPGDPIAPQAQAEPDKGGAHGRQFDFDVNYNIRRMPRDGAAVSFEMMRALADGYDLLRLAIETRKDQMVKLKWSFALKEKIAKQKKAEKAVADATQRKADAEAKAKEPQPVPDPETGAMPPQPDPVHVPEMPEPEDPRITELTEFFEFPDQEHNFETWLRALLEDLLVMDAPTLYPRETLDGSMYALELIDGATVKRLIGLDGRTPLPPEPAYQQVLKGMPAVNYSRDELIYMPRNVRTNKVYGYSPVEQIIVTVNIAIRRQMSQLQYYTEGNIPEAFIGVPEDWNPDQIKQFQAYWDSIMEGNTASRRHAKFVPGGMDVTPTREPELKNMFDEWLARLICFCFSLSPQALVAQMNRATAETANDQALSEGLAPLMNWVKNLIDYVVWKHFGYKDLEFKWEEEDETNPKDQMTTFTGYKAAGVMTSDEIRERLGMDPMTPEQQKQVAPPPPPMLGGPPGKPGEPKPFAAGGTDKPVGKTLAGSGLLKAKRLSRSRPAVQTSTNAIAAAVGRALAAAQKEAVAAFKATNKAISADKRTTALLEQLTFDELQDIAPELAEILEDMTGEAGEAALAQVLSDVTEAQLKQVNEYAAKYAAERSASLVTELEDATREFMRADITQAIEEGLSNDALADLLAENYGFSDARAEVIARTETAFADVSGNLEGYKASGQVSGKQWIISQDEICDECQELDGVTVGLDENFPGDGGDGPPLHPNCRCDIIPVLTEEE
jgi:SPP1 gp7 family putative phage head morphogenesis protein